jgi:hypothetical protein
MTTRDTPASRSFRGREVPARRGEVYADRFRDPPHRPARAAQAKNLLRLLVIQDDHRPATPVNVIGRRQLMAGFAVSD